MDRYTILPGHFLVVSIGPTLTLAQQFHESFPNQLFILSEINGTTTNGNMPPEVWEFLNNPKSSGLWEILNPLLWKGLEKPPGT